MEFQVRIKRLIAILLHVVWFTLISLSVISCGVEVENSGDTNTDFQPPTGEAEWLIPEDEIIIAQGKDGIPSIDDPKFDAAENIEFIPDERLVLGIRIGEEVRAYPLQIMDWHEIVNDIFPNKNVAVTYCPLTGTGIAWDRRDSEFGVSGLLFRNNLIPYDRNTESRWSQMQMRSVNGWSIGNEGELVDIIEISWDAWKKMYPASKVLTTDTGYDRDYQGYAYGNSLTENGSAALFPVKNRDLRLNKMEKVHGVIASGTANPEAVVRTYPIDYFGNQVYVVNDTLHQDAIVVAGSGSAEFAVSFFSELDGATLMFEAVYDELPVIMEDQEGNRWNIFGKAVSGTREGQQLKPTKSYTGYWFAWADFFPSLQIHPVKGTDE